MKRYANKSGVSVVKSYAPQPDGIIVLFTNGEAYTYTHSSAGKYHIEVMKELADSGQGLGDYIQNEVKQGYARQLK
jgi:hypothetical protein